jgi:hypothetical protein
MNSNELMWRVIKSQLTFNLVVVLFRELSMQRSIDRMQAKIAALATEGDK